MRLFFRDIWFRFANLSVLFRGFPNMNLFWKNDDNQRNLDGLKVGMGVELLKQGDECGQSFALFLCVTAPK